MKQFKLLVASLIVAAFGAFTLVPAVTVGALDPLGNICADNPNNEVCQSQDEDDAGTLIGQIVNTLLFIVGILSVIMIIFGGILYVISAGDASNMNKAKNTITYAVVGLVVSFIAYAIVSWVLDVL